MSHPCAPYDFGFVVVMLHDDFIVNAAKDSVGCVRLFVLCLVSHRRLLKESSLLFDILYPVDSTWDHLRVVHC